MVCNAKSTPTIKYFTITDEIWQDNTLNLLQYSTFFQDELKETVNQQNSSHRGIFRMAAGASDNFVVQ